jgi:N-acetylmuramoyl-L-alanine amidase
MRVEGSRLHGPGVRFCPSPNQGQAYAPGELDTLVVHYTACPDADAAIRTLADPAREVSAHLVVARDGQITQMVPFDRVGWHAGVSRWGDRQGLNRYALGIEIDNPGQLTFADGQYRSWFGQAYPETDVLWAVHRNQTTPTPWHRYPDVQVAVVAALCRLLVTTFALRHVLGHEEIAPDRKVDPGPAFPLDSLRGWLFEPPLTDRAWRGAGPWRVHRDPDPQAPVQVLEAPDPGLLTVLETRGDWCRVRATVDGWVPLDRLDLPGPLAAALPPPLAAGPAAPKGPV